MRGGAWHLLTDSGPAPLTRAMCKLPPAPEAPAEDVPADAVVTSGGFPIGTAKVYRDRTVVTLSALPIGATMEIRPKA